LVKNTIYEAPRYVIVSIIVLLLGCDAAWWCGRIPTFQRSVRHGPENLIFNHHRRESIKTVRVTSSFL